MQNYQDVHGRLPPAVVYGDTGGPLLSWRVLILPYMEQQDLYERFRLNEPWDSPHNSRLLARMPVTYAAPGSKRSRLPPDHTVCRGFLGPGAAFEGRQGLRLPEDYLDGIADTILVVEAGPPVPWTQPEGLPYDPDGPLPELPCLFHDGFRALFADGSVRWFPRGVDEATLRAAITRNGRDEWRPSW